MRLVLTGGGTGGHITPSLSLISHGEGKLHARLYIGEIGGLEERLCERERVPFFGIRAGKLRRYFSFKNFTDLFKIPIGFFQARARLKKFRPDAVFAKGGYVSLPVSLAAASLKIPIFLHESDVTPGLTTKLIAKIARKIFLSWDESKKYLARYAEKCEVVGNPVREAMLHGSRQKGLALTGFSENLPVILIMGGSAGAQSLNELVFQTLPALTMFSQIVHITGPSKGGSHGRGDRQKNPQKNYAAFDYLHDELADIYAITDFIVSRAGASSLAEIIALQKPNLLVPLGMHASRGDQIVNAEMCVARGWSKVFDESTEPPEAFVEKIAALCADRVLCAEISNSMESAAAAIRSSARRLLEAISETISEETVRQARKG